MQTCRKTHLRRGAAIGAPCAAVAALAFLVGADRAAAAEYCVTCSDPAAMYACVVQGSPPDAPADPREQLICISELARSGGHDTCSVPRSAPQPCPGVLKIVAPTGPLPPAPPPIEAEAPADEAPPADDDGGVGAANTHAQQTTIPKGPRTVEELAKDTVETSQKGLEKAEEAVVGTAKKAGEQVGKAGSTVGSAAKKTWDCVVSLFSDC